MAARNKRSFLTFEEQLTAFREWKAGDQSAADRIYKSYEAFILNIAWRYWKKTPNVDFGDLKSTAKLGFMEALDRYDPSKGAAIGTYAESWMKMRLVETIRLLSNTKHQTSNETAKDIYMAVTKKLYENSGASQSMWAIFESVAKERNMDTDAVRRNFEKSSMTTVSLNTPINAENDELLDFIADEQPEPADIIDYKNAAVALHNAISQLDERSGRIIRLRFGLAAENFEPVPLAELSKEYGISRERIRQIEQAALGKLRRLLENPQPAEHMPALEAGQL